MALFVCGWNPRKYKSYGSQQYISLIIKLILLVEHIQSGTAKQNHRRSNSIYFLRLASLRAGGISIICRAGPLCIWQPPRYISKMADHESPRFLMIWFISTRVDVKGEWLSDFRYECLNPHLVKCLHGDHRQQHHRCVVRARAFPIK